MKWILTIGILALLALTACSIDECTNAYNRAIRHNQTCQMHNYTYIDNMVVPEDAECVDKLNEIHTINDC